MLTPPRSRHRPRARRRRARLTYRREPGHVSLPPSARGPRRLRGRTDVARAVRDSLGRPRRGPRRCVALARRTRNDERTGCHPWRWRVGARCSRRVGVWSVDPAGAIIAVHE